MHLYVQHGTYHCHSAPTCSVIQCKKGQLGQIPKFGCFLMLSHNSFSPRLPSHPSSTLPPFAAHFYRLPCRPHDRQDGAFLQLWCFAECSGHNVSQPWTSERLQASTVPPRPTCQFATSFCPPGLQTNTLFLLIFYVLPLVSLLSARVVRRMSLTAPSLLGAAEAVRTTTS